MSETPVPTFNLSELREGVRREEFRRCLKELGVFYMTGYGASTEDHQRATDTAMDFFQHSTAAEKDAVTTRARNSRRGYSGLEAESTAQVTNNGDYTDYSMSYSMGVGGNLFPTRAFEECWTGHFDQLYGIAQTTAREVLTAVGSEPEGGIDDLLDCDPVFRLRYFPEVPEHRVAEEEPLRMAPHYDLSIVTLIHQTPCDNGFVSLQAQVGDSLVNLPYVQDAIIVMCGAVATLVSGGEVLATKHHVRSPGSGERIGSARTSSVFFLRPRSDFTFSIPEARRCGLDVSLTGEQATFAEWIGQNYTTMHTAAAAK